MFTLSFSKLALTVSVAAVAIAGLGGSYIVPLEHEAIQYVKRPVDDPVARLQKQLNSGEVRLNYESEHGYLKSVLQALEIPVESQVLVFSKTSFQAPKIAPRMPRALYFNDRVSVGFVRGGDVVEIVSQDPKQGSIFYTLDQERVSKPSFERRDSCLQCHQSGGTLGVPGWFVTSVFPDVTGMPLFQNGTMIVNQSKPIDKRWGGWYVTGTHGEQTHRGNALVRDKNKPDELDTEDTQNLTDLSSKFDTGAYPAPTSDIVALMVLEHQTHMTNLLTRIGWEARMAITESDAINKALGEPANHRSESTMRRINNSVEEMLEYMLFSEEAPISAPIRGTSGFAEVFVKQGPKDKQGRSLRDLDLTKRIFRYPLSYMIYSEAFDNLPAEAKDRVWRRLYDVLRKADNKPAFQHLSAADRRAIFEIVTATKKALPEWWSKTESTD